MLVYVIGAGTPTHAQDTAAQLRVITGKGEWQSLSGDAIKGSWAVKLTRNGNHVQGNLDLTGSNVFSGGNVSGDIDGSNVMLGVMVDGVNEAKFSGKLDNGSISGEWQSDAAQDSGVWSGTMGIGQPDAAASAQ